jgi:anti-anti-sigma regulatory factor
MGIRCYQVEDGRQVVIEVTGRFDFRLHREFWAAYEGAAAARRYVVDLRQASYVDSSALGMLLLLRDHAGGDRLAVSINAGTPALRTLQLAGFEALFSVLTDEAS